MEQAIVFILMTMIVGAPFVLMAWLAGVIEEGRK